VAADGLPLDGVREVVAEVTGREAAVDLEARPIPGGASREIWMLDLGGDADPQRLVLRRDPPGGASLASQEAEFEVMALAHQGGVPVPQPLHFEPEGGRFETAGFLMEFVEGESIPPRILRRDEYEDARSTLPSSLAWALAHIHALDASGLDHAVGPGEVGAVNGAIDRWQAELDEVGEPLPAVEAGLRWLRANAPPGGATTLVHGDFRMGNFLVDDSGLRAVLDWELSHLGDPAEDVGWLCLRSWRFGNDDRRVAGLCGLGEFLDAYERFGGTRPDPERVTYWETFGNVKWAIICARQAHDHMTGSRRSVELAALGRRICEPEWDLLQLIGAAQ
jgi:aminoglycoside phosphotransferase (APT) family kinase protein